MIAAREFTSTAEMQAHAAAVHRRCFSPKVRPAALLPAPAPTAPKPTMVIPQWYIESVSLPMPLWARETIRFDAHVQAWQWHKATLVVKKATLYIKQRCGECGVDYDVVVSNCRSRAIVAVRQLIMFEIRTEMKLSLPEIGRAFGGRDHTTVLHAVKKIEAQRAVA